MNASIDLRRLGHLVLLSEERNFTRAAERANLSQTAFSRSIQTLEAECGLQLFDRDTRSVQPTEAGRQVIDRARAVLANAQDLSRHIHELAHVEGGELRFGATQMAIDGLFAGLLPRLRAQSPGLRLDLEVGHWQMLLQHLEQERIEFFVGYPGDLAQDARFEVTPLPPQPASIFCRADHPLARTRSKLAKHRLLEHPWAAAHLDAVISAQLRSVFGLAAGAALPLHLNCDNQALLRETTLSSDTLLLTWRAWLSEELAQGRLIDLGRRLRPALPQGMLQLSCAIVRMAGRTASPAARRLMALLAA